MQETEAIDLTGLESDEEEPASVRALRAENEAMKRQMRVWNWQPKTRNTYPAGPKPYQGPALGHGALRAKARSAR